MPINKRVALAFAFAAMVVFCGLTAQAQSKYVNTVNGFEISEGHKELSGESYGWVFYGKTSGYLPGNLTLTMNCQARGGADYDKIITGGNWTMPVYTKTIMGGTTYTGVLYGTVTSGTFTWDEMSYSGTMSVKLQITGGTQTMATWHGTANFEATVGPGLAPILIGTPPPVDGTLTFDFQ